MQPYAVPTPEAVALIAEWSPIVEIGAGDGAWARALREAGATVQAFDINPRGKGVDRGDHMEAAQHDGALLAVWPPDGAGVQAWIGARAWRAVILVASFPRLDLGDALAGYREARRLELRLGRKGGSGLRLLTPA